MTENSLWGFSPEDVLGRPTLHVPMNFITQDMGGGKVIGVFQTASGTPLLHNSTKTHQLILGDVFIRPRVVYDTDAFRGAGMQVLTTNGFANLAAWQDNLLFLREGCG